MHWLQTKMQQSVPLSRVGWLQFKEKDREREGEKEKRQRQSMGRVSIKRRPHTISTMKRGLKTLYDVPFKATPNFTYRRSGSLQQSQANASRRQPLAIALLAAHAPPLPSRRIPPLLPAI
jgi:hypothetical protein